MRTLLVLALALSACGGSEEGTPFISGAVTGSYKGEPFQASFGFATTYDGIPLIGVGDGPLNCGSPDQRDPPTGTNALIAVPELAAGDYSNVLVEIMQNHGNFEGEGSNMGTVTLSSVTAESIAGTVDYSYTNSDGEMFSLSGTFEIVHCEP